ncbi:hypothetical protein ITY26_004032 [Salmonella enterica]|uniref:hypothetical protein n=1 Tax=Salmonella enterica TaxID=28901 RepID=UPI000D576834|nr:hypothetical protein [Salmonella enterica]EEL4625258.1 hypothetical protein [Salmonella enterica subsp. enterica serovar Enteritidis]EAZ7286676.1 hypothetical protein [Salmonella enterica]ECE1600962.1 hypothetical protein [Salmonella enterica]EDT9735566.1 hypothetical protein [Salmonella enterica]EDY3988537.1 hypothetical protein [Salmonella enterica]
MSLFRNGSVAAGKRLEVFRETVGVSLYEPGKGWLPVGKRVHPGTERERDGCGSMPYSSFT